MPKQSNFSTSNKLLTKLPTKKKTENDRKTLTSYLQGEYGITYFNKQFTYKLQHIHEGTLQNLQVPITYDVLLDMFKRYKNELDKQRVYNKKIGKSFSDKQGVLNYDLAIILSKHSDYLLEQEEIRIKSTDVVLIQPTAKLVNNIANMQSEDNGEVDIDKMLNEW